MADTEDVVPYIKGDNSSGSMLVLKDGSGNVLHQMGIRNAGSVLSAANRCIRWASAAMACLSRPRTAFR